MVIPLCPMYFQIHIPTTIDFVGMEEYIQGMTKSRKTSIALLAAKAALGASLALGLALSPHSTAHVYAAPPACAQDAYAREVGDDNCDGTIMEDESGWDCATMGNRTCGRVHYPAGTGPVADYFDEREYA